MAHRDRTENYLLAVDEWKHDTVPEIINGKNVADFVDPDIFDRLEELEREEERLAADGFYDSEEDIADSDEDAINLTSAAIRRRKDQIRQDHSDRKHQGRPIIPRPDRRLKMSDMASDLRKAGLDPSKIEERAAVIAKARKLAASATMANEKKAKRKADEAMDVDSDDGDAWEDEEEEGMDVDEGAGSAKKKRKGGKGEVVAVDDRRRPGKNRQLDGMRPAQVEKARQLQNFQRRGPNRFGKQSESDRHIAVKCVPLSRLSGYGVTDEAAQAAEAPVLWQAWSWQGQSSLSSPQCTFRCLRQKGLERRRLSLCPPSTPARAPRPPASPDPDGSRWG